MHCERWRKSGAETAALQHLEVVRVWQVVLPPDKESDEATGDDVPQGWAARLLGPGVRHGPVHWERRVKHVCSGDVDQSMELPILAHV